MESEWVKTEIAKARKREVRDQRRVLFPIRLAPFEILRDCECFDADTGKDSATRDSRVFHPRLQQLEEPRLLSGSLPAPDQRFESLGLQAEVDLI